MKKRDIMISAVRDSAKPLSTGELALRMYKVSTPYTRTKVDNWGSTLCNRESYKDGKYPAILKRYEHEGQYWYTYYGTD